MSTTAHWVDRHILADSKYSRGYYHCALLMIVVCATLLAPSLRAQAPTRTPGATAVQTATEEPEWFKGAVRPGPGVTNPTLIKSAKPEYTKEAMEARVTGDVWLDVRVDVDGRVRNARIVRSLPMLDAQAEKAAKEFEFRPAMKDGEPVPIIVRLEIGFNLRSTPTP